MFTANGNYLLLKESYLFSEIAAKTAEYKKNNFNSGWISRSVRAR